MDWRQRNIASAVWVATLVAVVGTASAALGGEVDLLAITEDFHSLSREQVLVSPVPQPPAVKGKLEIAPNLARILTDELVRALRRELRNSSVAEEDPTEPARGGLVLRARFSKLVPGSRAKRFWIGFGAGKSVTEISGEVVDGGTGRVVARFTHARLSWCCGYGDNDQEVRANIEGAASDVAGVVAGRFDRAQTHTWLVSESPKTADGSHRSPMLTGTVSIEASVEHAEVHVDGRFVGTTPLELPLTAGAHVIEVAKPGFRTWAREIHVIEGANQALWVDVATGGSTTSGTCL